MDLVFLPEIREHGELQPTTNMFHSDALVMTENGAHAYSFNGVFFFGFFQKTIEIFNFVIGIFFVMKIDVNGLSF